MRVETPLATENIHIYMVRSSLVKHDPDAWIVDENPPGPEARHVRRDPKVYVEKKPCGRRDCDGTIIERPSDEKCTECDYFDAPGKCNSCLADLEKIDEQAHEGWEMMPHTIVMGCPNGCDYTKEHKQHYP